MKRHLVLVGLPGSGKSTAGKLAAQVLRAPFVDVDVAIEARAGRPISRIFAEDGEPAFREMERREVLRVLAVLPSIVAPGGGWAARPGNLEEATMRAVAVYLETAPTVAARRLEGQHKQEGEEGQRGQEGEKRPGGQNDWGGRPLLAGGALEARLRELLAAREPFYRAAQVAVVTDGKTPAEVAQELVTLARTRAGW